MIALYESKKPVGNQINPDLNVCIVKENTLTGQKTWLYTHNIVTNDQLEDTNHLSGATSLFRDGQVVNGATKFHINTYSLPLSEKEHVVSTNIQMDVSKIGDDTFNIQLRTTP